jgi:hypothetical protein
LETPPHVSPGRNSCLTGLGCDETVTVSGPFFKKEHEMAYSPEVGRPNNHRNPPQASAVAPADEVRTIALNQISWGAVFAGATIADSFIENGSGFSVPAYDEASRSRGPYTMAM